MVLWFCFLGVGGHGGVVAWCSCVALGRWCCVVLCEDRSNDDRSYGTYSSAMLEIKNNRKRAEGDLQLLENRILLLKVIWVYAVGG